MATNGSFAQQEQYKSTTEQYPATSGATDTTPGAASGNDLSKDEVGWYFVEQYYTTLSKSPEKLHVSTTRPRYASVLTCDSSSMESDLNSCLVLRRRLPQFPLVEL